MPHYDGVFLKVVVLGTRGFPGVQGGVETHCKNLYPRLAAKGYEIIVVTRARYVDPAIKEFKGVELISLTCPKNKYLEAFVHTFKGVLAAKRLNPDIVHIHASGPSLCIPMVRMLGMKAVMTSHGPEHLRKKWAGLPKYLLMMGEYLGVTWANAVISVSEANVERLRRNYRKVINAIPNGVVIPEAEKTRESLEKYGLEVGRYLLAVGRFVPEKGLHDLIGAAVPQGWKMVIAGRADHEDEYSRELKKKAEANPNVILTGFITGKPLQELYSHAGLFILPSYYEGLPIALLEAMSYGLSCIISDIPANREVGLSEERYFRAGDIEGLCLKIIKFAAMPMTEEEKVRQLDLLKQKYNWDKIAEETRKVYHEIK